MWMLLACLTTPAEQPVPIVPPIPPPVVEAVAPEPLPATGPFKRELATGLVVAAYDPPEIPDPGFSRPPAEQTKGIDRRLFVVTIDPAHYALSYLSILDDNIKPGHKTAAEWATAYDLQVAFNPGMFEPRYEATGYTRSGTFVSQPKVRSQRLYRGWFVAADRVEVLEQTPPAASSGKYAEYTALPAAFRSKLDSAAVVSQSLPILLDGKAAYPARKNQWSELAYGVDDKGRLVVVFTRYPYEMRELGHRITALDLGITGLIHGEGGPEASLVVRVDGVELIAMGSYETGFFDDSNTRLWQLPAVLGARPRTKPSP